MRFAKTRNYGNEYIGLFSRTSDEYTLLPPACHTKFKTAFQVLSTTFVEVTVADSSLLGLLSAMNSKGVVLSRHAELEEVKQLKKLGLNVCRLKSNLSAIGNNIAVNNNAAIVNPNMDASDAKEISDCLGVEVVQRGIAGFQTVGCACVATNKGFLTHNNVGEEELKTLEEIFKVRGGIGSLNMGVEFVGVCISANSHGFVVGETTSGYEMQRATEALGFV